MVGHTDYHIAIILENTSHFLKDYQGFQQVLQNIFANDHINRSISEWKHWMQVQIPNYPIKPLTLSYLKTIHCIIETYNQVLLS